MLIGKALRWKFAAKQVITEICTENQNVQADTVYRVHLLSVCRARVFYLHINNQCSSHIACFSRGFEQIILKFQVLKLLIDEST